MSKTDNLYKAFGDLLYAIALSDGDIQTVELERLETDLKQYPEAKNILLSFYQNWENKISVDEAYQKAIAICRDFGPSPKYAFLIELMIAVADAYMGIVPQEKKVLTDFITDMRSAFTNNRN